VWASIALFAQAILTLINRRPDAVYVSISISGYALWRDLILTTIFRFARVPRIYHLHMRGVRERYERSAVFRIVYPLLFSGADVIHLSQRLFSDVECVVPAQKFYVVANGVGAGNDTHQRAISTPESGRKAPVVVFLSNLFIDKGPLDLLEASKRIASDGIPHELVFAGAGTDQSVVDQLTSASADQSQPSIKWLGPVYSDGKAVLLRSADIFVFPSYYHFECQPLVVIEAMAYGLSIIASDLAAIPDLIRHETDGLLIEPRNVDELTSALRRLLADEELRQRLGKSARQRYIDNFTIQKFENRLVAVLSKLCK